MWVHMAQNGICVPPPVSHHCAGGQGPCDLCDRTVLLSHVTPFAFSVIATLTRLQITKYTNAEGK